MYIPCLQEEELPATWTVAYLLKLDKVLYIAQRTATSQVVFKRELPFTLKSLVRENILKLFRFF